MSSTYSIMLVTNALASSARSKQTVLSSTWQPGFPLAVLFVYREEKRLNQNKKPNFLRLLVLVVAKQVLCRYSGSHPQPKDMCTRLVSSPQLSAGVSGSLINHTLALGATLPLPHVSWDSSPVD